MQTDIISPQLNTFLENRQKEILAIAHKATDEVVKTELSLTDFELLLAVNMSKKESGELTKKSRKIREEGWQELSKKFNGDINQIQEFLLNSI